MSDYMILEQRLTEMMEELAVLKVALGVEAITISDDRAWIHGEDNNGRYIVSNPEYGKANGILFRAARTYTHRGEDE